MTTKMTFDIIQPQYLSNLKSFLPYYKFMTLLASIVFILSLFDIPFFSENKIITIISISIIGIYFILTIADHTLFSRIGDMTFEDKKIVITKGEQKSDVLLSEVKLLKIKKVDSNWYFIEVDPLFGELIEINEYHLMKLKKFLSAHQIEYQQKSAIDRFRIGKIFSKK